MRDIVLAAIMAVLVPLSFVRPWIGILVWSWLGYMNPHQYCWGFANSFVPWAEMVAIATMGGFVLTGDRKPFVWSRETVLMLSLWGWFTITTMASWYPHDAWPQWERVSKILLMSFMTIPLIQSRYRLRWLLLVIAGSLGFYGFKGGLFVLATGGHYKVLGAPGRTFVSGNTTIALALNMCLPLFWYLRKDEPRRWLRSLLLATFCLSVLAVLFTYSRGGLLGLGCVLAILGARSKQRYLALPLVALTALLVFAVAPQQWVERMQTIETYHQDESAMGRLMAWRVGYEIANDSPLVGGGFEVFNQRATYLKYAPQFDHFLDAHSIYFNLLGEHGYVGLGLFLLLISFSLGTLVSIYRVGRRHEELAWVSDFAHMLGAGIVGYLVSGAFLERCVLRPRVAFPRLRRHPEGVDGPRARSPRPGDCKGTAAMGNAVLLLHRLGPCPPRSHDQAAVHRIVLLLGLDVALLPVECPPGDRHGRRGRRLELRGGRGVPVLVRRAPVHLSVLPDGRRGLSERGVAVRPAGLRHTISIGSERALESLPDRRAAVQQRWGLRGTP